jgi:steroid 5-alpha reductase family enzyme
MLLILLAIFLYANAWFLLSIFLKRNDVADIAWGIGYILIIACLAYQFTPSHTATLISALVCLWAFRLSSHIAIRTANKSEDFRYRQWRIDWGHNFYWRSWLQVYLLQAAFMTIIAIPIFFVWLSPNESPPWSRFTGAAIFLTGFLFQAISDYQLARFLKHRRNNHNILNTGLWKYSRHPNYFGEILVWWGIFIIVAPIPFAWLCIISPLTITLLLRFVSGIPMVEKRYLNHPEYQQYRKKTPMLIPGKPSAQHF